MKFRFYDILSHLIPGFIVYLAYLEFVEDDFSSDFIIPATAIAFLIGYFVNILASWLEDFYFWTWGGKPSNRLLNGKDIWKVRFYEGEKVKRLLLQENNNNITKNDALFGTAMQYIANDDNSRIADFNSNYAFSRVILTVMILGFGILAFKYFDSIIFYLISLPLVFATWLRAKQRGYYYAREVLKMYLRKKEIDG